MSQPKPTDAQLAILNVLWSRGPSTVREVHEALPDDVRRGYTTTLKLMQIMAEKGLVERDESTRSHVYTAALERGRLQDTLVGELLDKAFGGGAGIWLRLQAAFDLAKAMKRALIPTTWLS